VAPGRKNVAGEAPPEPLMLPQPATNIMIDKREPNKQARLAFKKSTFQSYAMEPNSSQVKKLSGSFKMVLRPITQG
jgi:hypothetical protein